MTYRRKSLTNCIEYMFDRTWPTTMNSEVIYTVSSFTAISMYRPVMRVIHAVFNRHRPRLNKKLPRKVKK